MRSCLYECNVMHRRDHPRRYAFNTKTFMFHLDLDEIDLLCSKVPILSRNSWNLYSFNDSDHIQMGFPDVRSNIEAYLREQLVSEKPARIELITNVRCMGYNFNPVSFYICRDTLDHAFAMVAEVHNTFGELKPFLVLRSPENEKLFTATHDKHFYISPFSELDHLLELKLHVPSDRLALHVRCRKHGEDNPFLFASLTGARRELTTTRLLAFSLRFPFITLKVMTLIHWHALKLYRLGIPFHRKTEHTELQTGIYPKAQPHPQSHQS
jgi:uncharacterized protein